MLVLPQSGIVWKISEPSREVTVDEMVNEMYHQPYFDASGGSVCRSSEKPFLQNAILRKSICKIKRKWCAPCLDTSAKC